jgi:hypothetical protein
MSRKRTYDREGHAHLIPLDALRLPGTARTLAELPFVTGLWGPSHARRPATPKRRRASRKAFPRRACHGSFSTPTDENWLY